MTRLEAKRVMQKGFKVTHRYFLPTEWMTIEGEYFRFEDGALVEQSAFWAERNTIDWHDGFEYWKEVKHE